MNKNRLDFISRGLHIFRCLGLLYRGVNMKSLKHKISFGLETYLPPSNKSGKDQTGQLGPIADGFIAHHS